jgi:hypothetical protein
MAKRRPKIRKTRPAKGRPPFLRSRTAGALGTVLVLAAVLGLWSYSRERTVWTVLGEGPNNNLGLKVAPAGDVNGDGYADVAVWAPGYDEEAGKLYIYLGSPRGLSRTPAWTMSGEQVRDQFGHSFGTIGDVNGSGFGAFIVGAQGYNAPGAANVGKAYIYLGSPRGLNPVPSWTKTGDTSFELLGDCSGPAGDINKDGLSDVVIGSYGFDHFRGKASVYYGRRTGVLSQQPAWTGYGEDPGDWYGYSVASCGDIKGDGYTGVVIGAKHHRVGDMDHAGKVYVYYGSPSGLPKAPSWTAVGEAANEYFGWRALPTGDIRGDGHNGLMISGYQYGIGRRHIIGKVYVYYGTPQGLPSSPSWTREGEENGSLFGYTIASGHFTGSAYSDILVGAPNFHDQRGKVYLFKGGPAGLSQEPAWTCEGKQQGEKFGSYVANTGDITGSGVQDFIVGAPSNSERGHEAGKAYLFYGRKGGLPSPYLP